MPIQKPYISPDAHVILRDYAASPHHASDLKIGTANRAEKALSWAGVDFPGARYPAGMMTRQYSRNQIKYFPDKNVRYLKNPALESLKGKEKNNDLQEQCRQKIAELVGIEKENVGNGTIKRLLDKPEICDLLVQYYNESQLEKFREYIQKNTFFKLSTHRLQTSKNKSRHSKPATLGSYIARTFCPEDMSTIESQGKTDSSKRREVLSARLDLMRHLPIDPDAISDDSLVKV